MAEHSKFIWNELVTSDTDACGEFYSALLGWTRKDIDSGEYGIYTIFQSGGENVAGMMKEARSDLPVPRWHSYISVADLDAHSSRVAELGGKIIEPPTDIPGVGRICMIADPGGAIVTLMTPVEEVTA